VPTRAFTIQKLAVAVGVGVEAVRYYQRRGVLAEPERVEGGFREYTQAHVDRLRFIKRGQELGFSLDDIGELLSLSWDKNRTRVRDLTKLRVAEIRARIAQLESMAAALEGLADTCRRNSRSQGCPIIAALASESGTRTHSSRSSTSSRSNSLRSSVRNAKAMEAA
jgi:MerR family mercuric resistance operon transcriptional regulator